MRTKGLMGITVEKLTKRERDDMFALLDRMEKGVNCHIKREATPALVSSSTPSYGDGYSDVMAKAAGADNVVMLGNKHKSHQTNTPHKAFPPEFYEFFEFVEDDVKFG